MFTISKTTSISAIILMIFAAILGSVGQIFYKFASQQTVDAASLIFNSYLYLGVGAYGLGLIFMLAALRRGELTVVYPVMATSFIWVSILSPIFFETDFMTINKWIGIAIIILGVAVIGKGRSK